MNTLLALAVGLSALIPLVESKPILEIPYDPNQNRHLFSSIAVKDTADLPETIVTFKEDATNFFQVKKVVSSSAVMVLSSDLTADQVNGKAPWTPTQAVRIAPDDAATVLTFYITKRVAVSVQHAQATIRISDGENTDTRHFNVTEFASICPLNDWKDLNMCEDSGNKLVKLPSFRLPRYEDLPSWARNQHLINLTFSIEDSMHHHNCGKGKKLISAHLRLSTVADDLE